MNDRRLIEDYLPIEAISKEASREKSVRKGHISTLHLWWARRPLVACRAAVYGALVPASRFRPANGPEEKRDSLTRANAAKFVERLCQYPGSPQAIAEAQKHILEAHAERLSTETGKPVTVEAIVEGRAPRPKVLDMFAGGGAIPLEALRLGCEAYALDINPVAHIIELCTLVYPQKYGRPDPNARGMTGPRQAGGLSSTWGGLADEVRYWGNWVLEKVKAEIGDLYPLIPDPKFKGERGRTGVPPVISQTELFQTRRHLPHWQIGSSVYFITFSTRKEGGWSSRLPLDDKAQQIVLDSLLHWHGTKIKLHVACVMPDHVHALLEPLEESPGRYHNLSKILQSIKSFSAHELNKLLRRSGSFWEEESWDRLVRDEKDYHEKWNYILNNPVKSGLVEEPEKYPFLWIIDRRDVDTQDTDRRDVCPPSSKNDEIPPGYLVPVAYLWTRTVRCKNPTCGATVPLVRQTWLCKKKGRYVALKIVAPRGKKEVRFEIVESTSERGLGFDPAAGSKGGNATCTFCGTVADSDYVKAEGCAKRLGHQLMAVACIRPGHRGKVFLSPDEVRGPLPDEISIQAKIVDLCSRTGLSVPNEPIVTDAKNSNWTPSYGLVTFGDLFTARQLLYLLTLASCVRQAHAEMLSAGYEAERARALASYMGVLLNRQADYDSTVCMWESGGQFIKSTFTQKGIPLVWDLLSSHPSVTHLGHPRVRLTG